MSLSPREEDEDRHDEDRCASVSLGCATAQDGEWQQPSTLQVVASGSEDAARPDEESRRSMACGGCFPRRCSPTLRG